MNYAAYIHRRISDLYQFRFRLQKLFSVIKYPDFDKLQSLLNEVEEILKKYENA